ncbi:MAG: cobalamin [Eubacterium sp.]|jgi:cobalt-precorrin 5A hydrolase|nr:cobalamin [Eubacterium sp.]
MKIHLAAFTKQGGLLCLRLQQELLGLGCYTKGYCTYETDGLKPLPHDLKTFTGAAFDTCDAVVFIGAAGIAVRAIAPFITSKDRDPAVLVIDETGRYIIPVLSGHIGGANSLAGIIADILSGQAVITTATDIRRKFAVDSWAVANGCHISNVGQIKYISAALLNGEQVGLVSDFPVDGSLPEGLNYSTGYRAGICISSGYKQLFEHTLHLVPKQYVLGVGCRKNIQYEVLLNFVNTILAGNGIQACEIGAIASIDLKCEEEALLMLSRLWRIPFYTYTAQELLQVSGDFTQSAFVKEVTGVDNVCERAAVKASKGKLTVNKISGNGITAAIAKREWRCKF